MLSVPVLKIMLSVLVLKIMLSVLMLKIMLSVLVLKHSPGSEDEADWKLLINRRRRGRTASTPGIDDELGPLLIYGGRAAVAWSPRRHPLPSLAAAAGREQ